MDANKIQGTTLQRLVAAVMPPTLPTIEKVEEGPRDVIDVRPGSAPPASAPVQPGFVPFHASVPLQAAGAEAPTAAPPAAAPAPAARPQQPPVNNNPTVLTMEDPAPTSPIDERKPPIDQARDLGKLLLQQINGVSKRRSAISGGEVREHLALMGWAAQKLESLSQQVEAAGDEKSNKYIESMQRDLGQAIQSFRQIHQGTIESVQTAQMYRTRLQNESGQEMAQFNFANTQRRAGVIAYAQQSRTGFNGGMGMGGGMMPGMMPGMPGMMPGMPGMMPGMAGFPGQLNANGVPLGPNGMPMPGYGGGINLGGPPVALNVGGPGAYYGNYGTGYSGYPTPGFPQGVPTYPSTTWRR